MQVYVIPNKKERRERTIDVYKTGNSSTLCEIHRTPSTIFNWKLREN